MMNPSVLSGVPGLVRILTLVIGVIDVGFTADSYLHHYTKEEFLLAVVIVCVVLSLILLLLLITFHQWEKLKTVDIYHIIAASLLMIGGILMLYSVFSFGRTYSRWYYGERISSGVLGIINAFLYGILTWLLIRKA